MNKRAIVLILLAILAIIAIVLLRKHPLPADGSKRRECPESWYENHMPGVKDGSQQPSQYLVISGERVELNEVDLDWVKQNCPVHEPTPVY